MLKTVSLMPLLHIQFCVVLDEVKFCMLPNHSRNAVWWEVVEDNLQWQLLLHANEMKWTRLLEVK